MNQWKNGTQHYRWLKDMGSRSGMPTYYAVCSEDHEWSDDSGENHIGPDHEAAWKLLVGCWLVLLLVLLFRLLLVLLLQLLVLRLLLMLIWLLLLLPREFDPVHSGT